MNVELVVDSNNKAYLIDIGPRVGGNMIPDLLSYIFNINVIKTSILSAVGENYEISINEREVYLATNNFHVKENKTFERIEYKEPLKSKIIKECGYRKKDNQLMNSPRVQMLLALSS